jgi:putative SOS response-associated peptidase YedK
MCGRYTLFRLEQLLHRFPWIERPPADAIARYNIAPTQPVLVIPNERPDRFDYFNWGLIPPWAKDPSVGNRMINARVETIAEKPAYAKPFRRRRCLVPADGFYEWRKDPDGKSKTPMHIRMKSGEPLLNPYPAEEMAATPVSRLVNSPKNETPDCIKSAVEETLF